MGLSSKQVTVDGIDWGQGLLQTGALELQNPPQARRQQQQQQQQQQQPPPLRCPRCDSANTKFCYYNNYNKSQPRHFCKACRRHWTKGGTLRNVPVGGRRKNKRVKTSSSPSSSSSTTSTITATGDGHLRGGGSNNRGIQFQQQEQLQQQHMPLPFGDQESFAEILYQVLLPPPSSQPDCLSKTSYSDGESIDMNTSFLASTKSLPQIPNFSFGNLSTFGNNPSISGLQSSHVYDYAGKLEIDEEPTTTAAAAAMSTHTPWQEANDSSFMDSSSYWSFDDLTTFVNTDLEKSWVDDFGQKQQGN